MRPEGIVFYICRCECPADDCSKPLGFTSGPCAGAERGRFFTDSELTALIADVRREALEEAANFLEQKYYDEASGACFAERVRTLAAKEEG